MEKMFETNKRKRIIGRADNHAPHPTSHKISKAPNVNPKASKK
jgi:hypothetical protein